MAQCGDAGDTPVNARTDASASSSSGVVVSAVESNTQTTRASEGHANQVTPSRTVRVAANQRSATPPPPASGFQAVASAIASWKSERYEAANADVDSGARTRTIRETARRRAATPPGRACSTPKLAAQCKCGNIYTPDSIYCHKCGVKRPSIIEPTAEYEKSLQGLHHLDLQTGEHAKPLQCEKCGEPVAKRGTVRVFVACLIGVSFTAKVFFERQQISSIGSPSPHSSASMGFGSLAAFVMHLGAILPGLPSTNCRGALWLVVCKLAMTYVCALAFFLYQASNVRCLGWVCTAFGIVRNMFWLPLSVAAARDILHCWNSVTWYRCALGEIAVFAAAAAYMELLMATRFGHGQLHDWMWAILQTLLRSSGGFMTAVAHWYSAQDVPKLRL